MVLLYVSERYSRTGCVLILITPTHLAHQPSAETNSILTAMSSVVKSVVIPIGVTLFSTATALKLTTPDSLCPFSPPPRLHDRPQRHP
ncbi:hypothetical protein SISSUDRAFT_1055772, partial [Sistotremastrum suecicum HHB10207 ss-3]